MSMHWEKAISQSKKRTATREKKNGNYTEIFIRYDDGSCVKLVSKNGEIDFDLTQEAEPKEINGYNDWEPSK